MSLVGTRPPTLDEWEKYEPHHRARMSFRPGLTGLWQVSGRSNITDFEEVVKLDTQYIGNNVVIEDNTKFINYRPTAEFFDGIIDNGENQKLRNLGPIDIADNVYICSNVILYPNVKIGKNCLILDGSVITTSIEENSVVMGNPARVIAKIDDWYLNIKNINLKYPWYNKNISHDEIVRQREQYFFEGKQHEY